MPDYTSDTIIEAELRECIDNCSTATRLRRDAGALHPEGRASHGASPPAA